MQPGESDSGAERTTSTTRDSIRRSEDDYDLAVNAVSDGFRPSASTGPNAPSTSSPLPLQPDSDRISNPPPPSSQPTTSASATPSKDADNLNRPSSTSKSHPRPHDSLTLRNDGLTSTRNEQSPSSSSATHSDPQFPGPIQPSHPYQLYPQRTYSNATSSTEPLSSAYGGPRGPAHPYALYTQSTATPEDPSQQSIPVGFNGLGNGYRRQLGPDGEEAGDLIGPLGHMEELPPYTRYPDEACVAKPATEPAAATSIPPQTNTTEPVASAAPPSPALPIPGAGGIGLATRNPEFSSTEDDLHNTPQRTGSIRSVPSVESYHQVNGAARQYAEKPAQGKWQRRAKKKLWGVVPYWAICLLWSGIVIMGIIMGTVIGTIVTRQHGAPPPRDKSSGQKSVSDEILYMQELPHGLPPLDTGCYALPPMEKYQVPKACIKNPAQSPAWSCDVPFRWYSMNVTTVPDVADTSNYALKLAPFDPKASKFIWGSQPPNIPESQRLFLVKDLAERSRGPAWHLEVEYNKTVILREDQLQAPPTSPSPPFSHSSSSSSTSPNPMATGADKRHEDLLGPRASAFDKSRFMRKSFAASPGDKPWICTWPNIKLQVFIYANQTFASTKSTTSSSAGPSSTTGLSDTPSPTNYKAPYPKLVKFVERRPDHSSDAICTQYVILDGGRDKVINYDENHRPITIKINEVPSRGGRDGISDHFASSSASSWEVSSSSSSSLQERDVDLTPCGCVSFSWSV
ncbi:hypothetical protein E4U48_008245 [Claviceps purpurea]|nr:hypothetical protein E4U48_008245 [Claviceps purpurea]